MPNNKKSKKSAVVTTEIVAPAEVLQMKPADLMDMKLTRSELIDIITEEVESDLRNQQKKINKDLKALDKEVKEYFDNMDEDAIIAALLPKVKEAVKHARSAQDIVLNAVRPLPWGYHEVYTGQFNATNPKQLNIGMISLSVDVPEEFNKRRKELNVKQTEVQNQINRLSSKQGKLEILKQMLSASPEGKQLMEQIQSFKINAKAKLLGS